MAFVIGVLVIAIPSWADAALGDRTLQKGTTGEDVAELQEYLMTKGIYPYHTATGYFGPITEQAVIDFQQSRNLKVDGLAGPQTNHAIKVLRQGDSGNPVAEVQSQLKKLGYYQSSIDGIYGSGTASSVQSFQQDAGLVVDGIAGPNTRGALDRRVAPRSAAVGKELNVESTAYTANCSGCSGITKMGINLKKYPDGKVIAVDPSVIPLGSIVHVEGYGYAIAADIGGAIDGNKIDVFIPNRDDAYQWGRRDVHIRVIE
ncbi:peptidoglycan-binding protein [Alkalihalobacillus sp. AL-G]|uniref:peptidoglycan-binding protein n=1 Tax=Alkalihalobacillus sp. AL-G TaxID=2926399 RepID=UPI00272A3D98|nr:peptidoglycan-binding protein [Alkalihalobacillus sp. AL-G]